MKIYLAGPFFNETEVRNIEYAEQDLKDYDFDTMPRSEYEGKML